MVSFVDNTIFTAADAGTGSFTVAAAAQGYQSPAARVVDGEQYRYRAQSANLLQWEIGTAVASNGGTVFYRSVAASSTGALVDFIAPPSVILTFSAADFLQQASIDNKLVPDWIDPSVGFMPGRTAPTSTIAKIANAIKDVVVLNGDPAETYFIAIVCNKDVTFNNQIFINKVSDGSNVVIADPLEVDRSGGLTILEFGSAPRVKMAVDYSRLPGTGVILNDPGSPLLIQRRPSDYVSPYFKTGVEKFKERSSNPMRGEYITVIGDSEPWGVGASGASTTAPNTGALTDARNNFDAPSYINKLAKWVGQKFCDGEGYSLTDPLSAAYPAGTREYRKALSVDVCYDPQFAVINTATGQPVAKTVTTDAGARLGRTLDIHPGQELHFRHVGDWWKLVFKTQSTHSDAGVRPVYTLRGVLNAGLANNLTTYEAVPTNGNLENVYCGWDDWRVKIVVPASGAALKIECIENQRAVIFVNNALVGTWSGQWAPGTTNFDTGISNKTTTLISQIGKNDRILESVGSTTGPDNSTRTRKGVKDIIVGLWEDKPLADALLLTGSKAVGTAEVTGDPATYGYSMAEVSFVVGDVARELSLTFIDYYAVSAANDVPVYISNGTTTSGSASVTGITSTATLRDGMSAFGDGIPLGATIKVVSSTAITLSANATASATVPINFGMSQTGDGLHSNDIGHNCEYETLVDTLGDASGGKYRPQPNNYAQTTGFTMSGTIDMATQQLLLGGSTGGKLYDQNSYGTTRTLLHAKGDRFDVISQDGVSEIFRMALAGEFPLFKGAEMVWSRTNNVTAFAGGGQASATLLASRINRVSTVASPAASVKLPVTTLGLGLWCIVINSTANSLQVFGSGTDTINGVATATGVAVAAGKVGIYFSTASGVWFGGVLA